MWSWNFIFDATEDERQVKSIAKAAGSVREALFHEHRRSPQDFGLLKNRADRPGKEEARTSKINPDQLFLLS
jgi:hypothetical protein